MSVFFRATAAVLVASIIGLALAPKGKEFSLVITITVCCMVVIASISFLEPVLDLLCQLEALGQLNGEMMKILFKIVGIGLVSEIAAMICTDAGNASLGKALQMLGTVVILWLSIPVFQALLHLIQEILGDL